MKDSLRIAMAVMVLSVTCLADDPTKDGLPAFKFRTAVDKGGLQTSPDGRYTLRHSGMTAWIVDAATGKTVKPPLEHMTRSSRKLEIKTFAFSPNGRLLATGTGDVQNGDDDTAGEVYVWDLMTGKLVSKSTKDIGKVKRLAFSADGKTLLVDCLDISGK